MRAFGLIVIGSMLTLLNVSPAKAELAPKFVNEAVKVTWVAPDKFKDVASANSNKKKYQQRVIDDLEKYFHREIPKYLEPEQIIEVNVYDLDLAGDIRPMMNHGNDIRIVKSMYPPMIDIEYLVKDKSGNVIKQQRKRFRDITFNMGSPITNSSSLGYEKAMLKKWMRNELKR